MCYTLRRGLADLSRLGPTKDIGNREIARLYTGLAVSPSVNTDSPNPLPSSSATADTGRVIVSGQQSPGAQDDPVYLSVSVTYRLHIPDPQLSLPPTPICAHPHDISSANTLRQPALSLAQFPLLRIVLLVFKKSALSSI
ncbi:unnamed protein product [Protopolystoma xenopodis]|uniref:Uncharacterized protein n=1 Tax=Protopolystoma xenopodis TaxID=117903 RepID=A0A448X7Q5_9PLAT|nr:unnamed protein product [Protopolystoma xenopodis]